MKWLLTIAAFGWAFGPASFAQAQNQPESALDRMAELTSSNLRFISDVLRSLDDPRFSNRPVTSNAPCIGILMVRDKLALSTLMAQILGTRLQSESPQIVEQGAVHYQAMARQMESLTRLCQEDGLTRLSTEDRAEIMRVLLRSNRTQTALLQLESPQRYHAYASRNESDIRYMTAASARLNGAALAEVVRSAP